MSTGASSERRVVVVTGGGGGIGAAIAEDLGRRGAFVVTVDPLVSVDGSEQLPAVEETTAGRIVAGGGAAQASSASVTDRDAIHALFVELAETHGRLDAVVNVAGITRPTGFAKGTEEDWAAVLSVHLDGYRNVLEAALPIMAAAGRGHILGVTSGSGWRAADAGAYSCAKRAVASLTWQVGRAAPPGVVVNAISPIAVTRMVTAALARAAGTGAGGRGGAATGGLSLGSMPEPAQLGPFGSYLVGPGLQWCRGQVLFAGGSEVAVVEPPRLLEVIRTSDAGSVTHVLAATADALAQAEAQQATSGAANPRFPAIFDESTDGDDPPTGPSGGTATVMVVTDRPELGEAIVERLDAAGVATALVALAEVGPGFEGARAALDAAAEGQGSLDAVVLAASTPATSIATDGWARVLAEHEGIVGQIHADAVWARAVADRAAATGEPIRLVTLVDAATAGGQSRAQAAAQLSRAARRATGDLVSAIAVSIEGGDPSTVADLATHLVVGDAGTALAGAELVVAGGWVGLRSHPRPSGSIVFGGPPLPPWFDDALRALVGAREEMR